MPDFRGAEKTPNPVRTRPRSNKPETPEFGDNILDDNEPAAVSTCQAITTGEEHIGFLDEETNNRYEEIKRGTTHISRVAADDDGPALSRLRKRKASTITRGSRSKT